MSRAGSPEPLGPGRHRDPVARQSFPFASLLVPGLHDAPEKLRVPKNPFLQAPVRRPEDIRCNILAEIILDAAAMLHTWPMIDPVPQPGVDNVQPVDDAGRNLHIEMVPQHSKTPGDSPAQTPRADNLEEQIPTDPAGANHERSVDHPTDGRQVVRT